MQEEQKPFQLGGLAQGTDCLQTIQFECESLQRDKEPKDNLLMLRDVFCRPMLGSSVTRIEKKYAGL
jgi:hypothetical protein